MHDKYRGLKQEPTLCSAVFVLRLDKILAHFFYQNLYKTRETKMISTITKSNKMEKQSQHADNGMPEDYREYQFIVI